MDVTSAFSVLLLRLRCVYLWHTLRLPLPAWCLQALVSNNVSLSLAAAVNLAAKQQPINVTQQQQEAVLDFVGRRLEQLLMDAGVSAEAGQCVSVVCLCACECVLIACGLSKSWSHHMACTCMHVSCLKKMVALRLGLCNSSTNPALQQVCAFARTVP